MLSVAGTVGVADDAGIAASISIADIHTETDAYIADPTAVEAGGALTLSATGTFKTTMIAGSVGVGGTAGIGVANTTLVHTDTVQAYIGDGAQVTAGGNAVDHRDLKRGHPVDRGGHRRGRGRRRRGLGCSERAR